MYIIHVLEIYRITLLSNMQKSHWRNKLSFRDLQNYTTLKRHRFYSRHYRCFRDLQNYTTLKQGLRKG